MNPDYPRQHYDRERERQEKEMKDREQQMAVRAVRKYILYTVNDKFMCRIKLYLYWQSVCDYTVVYQYHSNQYVLFYIKAVHRIYSVTYMKSKPHLE
jgi:hypothetical protein